MEIVPTQALQVTDKQMKDHPQCGVVDDITVLVMCLQNPWDYVTIQCHLLLFFCCSQHVVSNRHI